VRGSKIWVCWGVETRNPKPATRDQKLKTRNRKPEVRNVRQGVLDVQKPDETHVRNPTPKTRNQAEEVARGADLVSSFFVRVSEETRNPKSYRKRVSIQNFLAMEFTAQHDLC